jgi:hypothetical protein
VGAYACPRFAKSIGGLGAKGVEKLNPGVATVGVPVYRCAAAKVGTVGITGSVGTTGGTTGVFGVVEVPVGGRFVAMSLPPYCSLYCSLVKSP